MSGRAAASLWIALLLAAPLGAAAADAQRQRSVDDLTLEELLEIEVTSASKKPERIIEVPAAVYVITQDDIRRSGHTSIPELLRMVPGVNVRRSTANNWHVGIRGDEDKFSRTLLVLIDGRSVYTPTFSGTYWDAQEVPLEDIERIEVIRGPGASVWGSNAVHGVINIIRKDAARSKGSYVSLITGNEETLTTSFSHGGSLGDALDFRASGRLVNRDSGHGRDGTPAVDDYRHGTLQLRSDWAATEHDMVTLQGDWLGGERGGRFRRDRDTTGSNFLVEADSYAVGGANSMVKWHRDLSERASTETQVYWDRSYRNNPLAHERRYSFDAEFRNHIDFGRNDVNWGVGARHQADRWNGTLNFVIDPENAQEAIYNAFVQDDFALLPQLRFTLGSKFEWNTYTGWEVQPTARFFYSPEPHQQFWGSLARAVRTPARSDRQITVIPEYVLGVPISFAGSEDFRSEVVIEGDLGYRLQPLDGLQIDLAAFSRHTDNFKIYEGVPPFIVFMGVVVPAVNTNGGEARALGGEASIRWEPRPWLRFVTNYSRINITSGTPLNTQGGVLSAPHHQLAFLTQLSLPGDVDFDIGYYHSTGVRDIGGLPSPHLIRWDARAAWRPTERLEVSLVGQNLFHRTHFEARDFFEIMGFTNFADAAVDRSVYVQLSTRF